MAEGGIVEHMIEACGTRKEQVRALITYLRAHGYDTAPASASHHSNYAGGLVDHSVRVVSILTALREMLIKENTGDVGVRIIPTLESCIIVGLCHDIHKITDGFGRANYVPNVLKSGKISDAKPYEVNKEQIALSGGYRSALIASRFIDLYEHEMQAIACHDGQYVPTNRDISLKEHQLTVMLHFADYWSAILIEDQEGWLYRKTASTTFCKDTPMPISTNIDKA